MTGGLLKRHLGGLRTGAPWADIPARYATYDLRQPFSALRKRGIWDRLLDAVSKADDGDLQMIDATSGARPARRLRPKKDSGSGGMGRSRGGLTSKIHALVDAEGRPVGAQDLGSSARWGAAGDMLSGLEHRGKSAGGSSSTTATRFAPDGGAGGVCDVKPMPNRKQVLAFSHSCTSTAIWSSASSARSSTSRRRHRADKDPTTSWPALSCSPASVASFMSPLPSLALIKRRQA